MSESDDRPDLLGLTRERLGDVLDDLGVGRTHARRVFRGIHRHKLPLEAIQSLGYRHAAAIDGGTRRADVRISASFVADDTTEKLEFTLGDGRQVEGVLIPTAHGLTFCVSSQVGCAMACRFCATARLDLVRGLTPGEIVAQVNLGRARAVERGETVTHIVFMGMGEPLHHYPATRDAVSILTDDVGMAIAPSRVTISTVGLAPRIRQLGRDFGGRVQLAVSLNAGTEATRRDLMPITGRYDLATLKEACRAYPLPSTRHVLIEYVLLAGVTDTRAELDGLREWLEGLETVVNLIPFNPFPGAPFAMPSWEAVDEAWQYLRDRGVLVTTRKPRGRDAHAACGQLALTRSRLEVDPMGLAPDQRPSTA